MAVDKGTGMGGRFNNMVVDKSIGMVVVQPRGWHGHEHRHGSFTIGMGHGSVTWNNGMGAWGMGMVVVQHRG